MARFINPFYFNNLIDGNILNDVADGQDDAVRDIVRLAEQGEISIILPYSVREEAKNSNSPEHVRRAADLFIFSEPVSLTEGEQKQYRMLVDVARGNAKEENIAADLFHVCEAAKYGGYFITRDKRLLARAGVVSEMLQIEIVTPSQFLEQVSIGRKQADTFR